MVHLMKVNIIWAKNMERGLLLGQIKVLLQENFKTTISMGMEFMNGLMAEFIREIGRTIKWKAMGHLLGLMEDFTLESTLMI